jgi:hypothetical protein
LSLIVVNQNFEQEGMEESEELKNRRRLSPEDPAGSGGFSVRGRMAGMRWPGLIRVLGAVPFLLLGWWCYAEANHGIPEARPVGIAIGLLLIAWGVFRLGMSLTPNQPPSNERALK